MASREWFLTKVLATGLSLMLIVSIAVGSANMFFELKRDVIRNTSDIGKHEVENDEDFEKVFSSVEALKDKNHALEMAMGEQMIQFGYIQAELQKLNVKIDSLEYAGAK